MIVSTKKNKKRRLWSHAMENLDLDSGDREEARGQQKKEESNFEMNFESMLDYKSPNIASGATPIGSAERAPDRDEVISMEDAEGLANKSFDYIVNKISRVEESRS
jgi:hypothetical protein